jgi:hypothetical protein
MWITELTTKTTTADSRIGSHSERTPVMTTSLPLPAVIAG